jgi:hypothetical protein
LPADSSNPHRPNAFEQILAHPYSSVTIVVLTAMGIVAVARHSSEFDDGYIAASRALVQGKDFYRAVPTDTYPPFSAWFFAAFTFLPVRLARGIWWVVCAVSLVTIVKMGWRLAGGSALEPLGRPRTPAREHIAFLIGHAIALQLSLNALTHCQTDLPIAALLILGCAAIAREKFVRAALWIGLAAAFKATPLLFAPYLLLRRRWVAAGLLVAVMIACNLLPDTIHRPDHGMWLSRWAGHYLTPMAKSNYVPGDWKNNLNNNQSLAGAAGRWLTSSPWEDSDELRSVHRPGTASALVTRSVFAGLCIGVMIPVTWAAWRRRTRLIPADTAPPAVDPHMIACGIIMLLMLLFSPNSSRAHFCVMYLAAFCVARIAVRPASSSLLRILLGIAVVSVTLSMHLRLPFTHGIEQIFLWVGVVMLSTIFLLLASCVALAELDR